MEGVDGTMFLAGFALKREEIYSLKALTDKFKVLTSAADLRLDSTNPLLAVPERAGLQDFEGLDGSEMQSSRFLSLFSPLLKVTNDAEAGFLKLSIDDGLTESLLGHGENGLEDEDPGSDSDDVDVSSVVNHAPPNPPIKPPSKVSPDAPKSSSVKRNVKSLNAIYPNRNVKTHPREALYHACAVWLASYGPANTVVLVEGVSEMKRAANIPGKFVGFLEACPEKLFACDVRGPVTTVKLHVHLLNKTKKKKVTDAPSQKAQIASVVRPTPAPPVTLVNSLQGLQRLDKLSSSCSMVGVDIEGDLSITGEIFLIQVAFERGDILILDLLAGDGTFQRSLRASVRKLMSDARVTKVFHGGRGDFEALVSLLDVPKGSLSEGFVDTQAIYGSILSMRHTIPGLPKLSGLEKPLGLNGLLARYDLPVNPHKDEYRLLFSKGGADVFKKRPLSSKDIEYAASDVRFLLQLKARLEADLASIPSIISARMRGMSLGIGGVLLHNAHPPEATGSTSGNAYAKALAVPTSTPLRLTFDAKTHRAQYETLSVLPGDDAEDDAEEGHASLGAHLTEEARRKKAEWAAAYQEAMEGLLTTLPSDLGDSLVATVEKFLDRELVELTLDVGKPAEARFSGGWNVLLPGQYSVREAMEHLCDSKANTIVGGYGRVEDDIWRPSPSDDGVDSPVAKDPFRNGNRLGLPGMLHRISAFRDREGGVYGLTYRLGVARQGSSELIEDLVAALARRGRSLSLLVVGRPGAGKTTLLRDIVRRLANTHKRNVVVCDTSNEIGGDSVMAHAVLGRARRMMVSDKERQHEVLLEAVANHMPDIVVVDELGNKKEADSVKSIAERGVSLVATCHGIDLGSVIRNPELDKLVGGKNTITVGDKLASAGGPGNQGKKTRTERAGAPVFDVLLELRSKTEWTLYRNTGRAVDEYLSNQIPASERRWIDPATGELRAMFTPVMVRPQREEADDDLLF